MSRFTETNSLSMQDFFATQGIFAVSVALLLLFLHLTAPDYCAALLTAWQQYTVQSPTPEALWEMVLQWFM